MIWKLSFLFLGLVVVLYSIPSPWLLYPVFLVVSVFLGGALALFKSGYELRRVETQPRPPQSTINPIIYRLRVHPPRTILPKLISTNVDARIQSVIELILKHHISPIYSIVASNHSQFFASLIPEIWKVLHALLKQVSQMDTMKLISRDTIEVLRKHSIYFRKAQGGTRPHQKLPDLAKFPYLESTEKELEFLRKVVETLLCVCAQREFLECSPVRIIIREFLVCKIIHPNIDKMCEPDYINQKLVAYLKKQEVTSKAAQKRYAHSETYEAFMQHIEKCEDISELTHIRELIITDILQAKDVQRMKKGNPTGLRPVTSLSVDIPVDKAKALMDRDLKLYITQLQTSKGLCERHIRKLGGEDYRQDHFEGDHDSRPDYPRPIPFDTIMNNERALGHFAKYLATVKYGELLEFWMSVQQIDIDEAYDMVQQMNQIHAKYLVEGAERAIYPDDELLQNFEEALRNGTNSKRMEALAALKRSVFYELHEHHYESFLYSQNFKDFMEGEAESEELTTQLQRFERASSSEDNIHKKRLTNLQRKLTDKDMMIASLKDPLANNENARVKRLEKGRTELKEEIKQLQRYIEHIDEWFGTVGKWNVEIANIDLTESDGYDKDPLMILVIYRPDSGYDSNQRDTDGDFPSISSTNSEKSYNYEEPLSDDMEVISLSSGEFIPKSAGWVLGRRLSEFQNLHQKICQVNDNIIFPPLPKKFSFAFNRKDSEKKYWESYCKALEAYINRVIQDPKMVESEEIFNFLSPASADMHKDTKTSRLLLREAKVDETILDSISSLVTEVFDLHERSRLLRRQIYELAQLTFGHGMEGELQDLMKWIVSEPMLVHYIEVFKESMWPGGQLGEPNIDRMDEEKEKTKEEAKDRFMKCAPQTLQTLLGQRNCQIGLLKMFTAFQDRNANKQLLYSFLELLMYALVPELNHVEVDSTSE